MRLVLVFLIAVGLAVPAAAAPIVPGTYGFSGQLTVSPILSTLLPGLFTGDDFSGMITFASVVPGSPIFTATLELIADGYTWGAIGAPSALPPSPFVSFIESASPLGGRGFLDDLFMSFPTDIEPGQFTATFVAFPAYGGGTGAVTGTYDALTAVAEPTTLMLSVIGIVSIWRARKTWHTTPPQQES